MLAEITETSVVRFMKRKSGFYDPRGGIGRLSLVAQAVGRPCGGTLEVAGRRRLNSLNGGSVSIRHPVVTILERSSALMGKLDDFPALVAPRR